MTLNQIEIDKLSEKMGEEWLFFRLDDILLGDYEELIKNFDKEDYHGSYDYTVTYKNGTQTTYELVYLMKCSDPSKNIYGVMLMLMYCPDEKIFEIHEHFYDYDWLEEKNIAQINTVFYPTETFKKTKENELITFSSTITEMKPDDLCVTVDGVNYQTTEIPLDEYGNPLQLQIHKDELDDELWQEIAEDSYMGRLKITYVNQIGEFIDEEVTIGAVENDILYCLDYKIPPINSNNIPKYMSDEMYVKYNLKDEEGLRLCYIQIDIEYIPYSLEEEL